MKSTYFFLYTISSGNLYLKEPRVRIFTNAVVENHIGAASTRGNYQTNVPYIYADCTAETLTISKDTDYSECKVEASYCTILTYSLSRLIQVSKINESGNLSCEMVGNTKR